MAVYALMDQLYLTPQIACVVTPKLMVGLSEVAEVERELNPEVKKWRGQVKELEDYSSRYFGTHRVAPGID